MKIQSMFAKDINRNINGVIKVAQDDQESLRQELSEYIVTRELRGHFQTFFNNYEKALDEPTDRIGVWISGFFGSGKSHFLKMISYILTNGDVCGKKAVEYFADKFDDPMMYAMIERCASVPTESILFNIDIEGPVNKDKTAVLRTFAKVFYNHLGFYGDDLKIVRLEKFIEEQGKTDQFRDTFEQVNGQPWTEARDSASFFEDDVVRTMEEVLGMSQQSARNWFNGEDTNELSIAQLVADIKKYVDGRGRNFRLLFMVDEVGQYIGDDGNLMINLQSIVEEIGTRCGGQVWVMVTSQEAIDSVVKIAGDDFSKIQGRFNTRLSLSSSSVDEVIKKRVLAKTTEADQLLRMNYDREQAVLKNLFTFNDAVLDIKGFESPAEFSEAFPFVPYQFILIQKVLAEIRKHGISGKHMSGGERSMLSGFQEAAQKVQDRDENTLVPFYLFYDTIHTFLDSSIRRVIDRCQTAAINHDGIESRDVDVLKLLYLIRYIDDIKANIDNIAILMLDDIEVDKIWLRGEINQSLDRLISQNYVARSGDTYHFLTDEEQEISKDIKNTVVDMAQITQSIAQIVYGEIYPKKKFKYGRYDLSCDQYVDDTLYSSAVGGMRLRILTAAEESRSDQNRLIMESQANNEAILILSDEMPYYDELEQAMKIRKYVKQRNVSSLPESVQSIIRQHQQQARSQEERAKEYLSAAITKAEAIVCGEPMEIKAPNPVYKMDAVLENLTKSVYTKIGMINSFAESDADIIRILNGREGENLTIAGSGADNEDALNELSRWLEIRYQAATVTMSDIQKRYQDIPYGWREIDIAAIVARLIAQQKISLRYGGVTIERDDRRLPDFLRKKSEIAKAEIVRKIAASEALIRKSIAFLRDYTGAMGIPEDEENLVDFAKDFFKGKRDHYQGLLDKYYAQGRYPEQNTVTRARDLMEDVLARSKDNVALLEYINKKQDDILDMSEDMEEIEGFFASQVQTYENAMTQSEKYREERTYFSGNEEAEDSYKTLLEILAMDRPYSRIRELPELLTALGTAYDKLLEEKKAEVMEVNRQCMADIHQMAEHIKGAGQISDRADDFFTDMRDQIEKSQSLFRLDARKTQISDHRDRACRDMESLNAGPQTRSEKITRVSRGELCPMKKLQSDEEIEAYVESIRKKLCDALENSDAVQIS